MKDSRMKGADTFLSSEAAAERFASDGVKDIQSESCWFLSSNGNEATVTLAYRVDNYYLNAIDGSWLQVEK